MFTWSRTRMDNKMSPIPTRATSPCGLPKWFQTEYISWVLRSLTEGSTHSCLETISTGTRKHFVDSNDVIGLKDTKEVFKCCISLHVSEHACGNLPCHMSWPCICLRKYEQLLGPKRNLSINRYRRFLTSDDKCSRSLEIKWTHLYC